MPNRYKTRYIIGQDNIQKFGMDIHHPVFGISAFLSIFFVISALVFPERSRTWFETTKTWSINHCDWLFSSAANLFVIFCLVLIVLPVGKVRLGGAKAKPEFSRISWFSMLFAAGMGIGLMFWSVAEPTGYFTNWAGTPLGVKEFTPEAAHLALGTTLFHWGLHPWAIYAIVGLTLAFFSFNKKLPLTIRSGFFPIFKDHAWGWAGHIIDVVAVLATIFGLATSLGFGAQQAAGGLHFLFGTPNTLPVQIAIVIGVTCVAIYSVVRGLDKGVKVLSNLNMALAGLLLLGVIIVGPTLFIFKSMGSSLVSYIEHIVPLSNPIGRSDQKFFHGWTIFYWAWWISWSPFVGMFIARISRGRTVREFLTAVLLIPTLVTTVWMGAFGGTAIFQAQNGIGSLATGINRVELALFQMLEHLPYSSLTTVVGIVVVLLFFVTSSDSGSLVVDSITAGGKLDAPIPQRFFWASMEGLIAGTLLFGGGANALGALQAAAISVGLPFTFILVIMAISLYMGLHHELHFTELNPQMRSPEESARGRENPNK